MRCTSYCFELCSGACMILSRASRERLAVLERRAEELERRIKHARCCPTPHRVGTLIREWCSIQDTMIRIESGTNLP